MTATGWALLAALVAGTAGTAAVARSRVCRRRLLIREALHELRRPLQAVALTVEGESDDPLVAQLRIAMSDLEDAIAGRSGDRARDAFALADLLDDASRRWGRGSEPVHIEPPVGVARLEADRVRLGMALDNLIANGLEHGRGPVEVAASLSDRTLRLEVSNRRRRGSRAPDGTISAPKGVADLDRGHGLRIAERQAVSDDGTLLPPRPGPDGAVVAAVEMPRADRGHPARR